MTITKKKILVSFLSLLIFSCTGKNKNIENQNPYTDTEAKKLRIVSLNSSVTETIVALGYQNLIVGVDSQSTFPENINETAKDLGHITQMSFESLLELKPDLVLATDIVFATNKGLVYENLKTKCKQANIELKVFEHEHSRKGVEKLIKDVAKSIGNVDYSSVIEQINSDFLGLKYFQNKPKVLFIYIQNTTKIMVAGRGTSMGKLIEMAGGENAAKNLDYYQPITPKSLMEIKADYLMLSTYDLEAVKGLLATLLQIPVVNQNKTNKSHKIITMDEELTFDFGPRIGQAVKELNRLLSGKDTITKVEKLKQALEQNNYTTFFKIFPNTFTELKEMYGYDTEKGPKPLYYVHYQHIHYLFENRKKTNIKVFTEKVYNIAKNGVWESDAVGFFQDYLSKMIIEEPNVFVDVLTTKSNKEVKGFWYFVFDTPLSKNDLQLKQKFTLIYQKINAVDQKQGEFLKERFDEMF